MNKKDREELDVRFKIIVLVSTNLQVFITDNCVFIALILS
jgi:hypothetical protein